jgi:SAM-dependent methyltransferase
VRCGLVCPICGGASRTAFASQYVEVVKCDAADCGHLFAADVADDHGVQSGRDEYSPAFDRRNSRLIRYWKSQGFILPTSRVLDVGAGLGHVASAVRQSLTTGTVSCVEPDAASRRRLAAQGFTAYGSLDGCVGEFSSIMLLEVIEHVPNPVAFLRRCRDLLTQDGQIFLTTPCGETRRGSRATNAYDTPEHVHFFSERSLTLACTKAGIEIDRFRTVNAMYPRPAGLATISSTAKALARPIRDSVLGARHLVCFATLRSDTK